MLENIAYVGVGFAVVLLGLEAAWHFTACKIKDKTIKPCLYKQIGILKQKGNTEIYGSSNRTEKSIYGRALSSFPSSDG